MASYIAIYGTSGISHTFADMRGAFKVTIQRGSYTTADSFRHQPHGHTHTHTGMTIYMNGHDASYICINQRTTVRATNHMCVVMYEAAKSHLCTCTLSGMRDSHIHTQGDYIRAQSQLFMYIHTQARPVINTRQPALHDMYII